MKQKENKEVHKEEKSKVSSFVELANKQKITLRLKVTTAQLKQLDDKETITVLFKGRNLEITCKGKIED